MKRAVYTVVEPQPIGAGGTPAQTAHGEYPTAEAAWAAKQALQAARPELVGCLLIEARLVDVAEEPAVVVVAPAPVVQESAVGEDERGGVAAVGAGGRGERVQRQPGNGRSVPAVQGVRPDAGRVPGPPVVPEMSEVQRPV
jgi:hypothetical protein